MWDRKMLIATISAVLGVLTMFGSMLQGITVGVRYGTIAVMIVCCGVFVWSFLGLGTEG